MLDNLLMDLRYAARTLARARAFSVAAIMTIALGVGVNTGIFTVVNGVLFRDLPAPNGHELVSIYQTVEGVPDRRPEDIGLFSTVEYETYRDRTQTLSGLLGHSDPTGTTLGGDAPRQIIGLLVTCNWFDVLEQAPVLGRGLTERDCARGADPVTVLDYDFWVEQFAADPAVIGRTVELNRQLVTVVGIAAQGGYGGFVYQSSYFAPISVQPLLLPREAGLDDDRAGWLLMIGRRANGVSLAQARAELATIAASIDAEEPGRSTTLSVERSTPLSIPMFRRVALAVGAVIMTAFGLVLLIACANVANLMLARSAARSRELALRRSLGASRARIVRQLLTESMLISVVGGLLGSVLALWCFEILIARILPSFSPPGIPAIVLDSSPDLRVLVFMLVVTTGTGVVFGLVPALRASKPDLNSVLKDDGAGAVGGRRGSRLQGTLVGAQVAVCMTLMISAGLLVRGLYATQAVEPGFEYRGVTTAAYRLAEAGYDADRGAVFQRRLLESVSSLPGVERAALVEHPPLEPGSTSGIVRLPAQDRAESVFATVNWVSAGYFDVVRIPIVAGRNFSEAELAGDASAAIVTQSTAARYWPGQDPIGQALLWRFSPTTEEEVTLRVVGVARDAQVSQIGEVDPYHVYLPATPRSLLFLQLLVRSRTDFAATAAGLRNAIATLDPGIAATIMPLESNIDFMRHLSSVVTSLAGSLGLLALLLASVGIYGVVAYFVSSRTREIGIRVALGAGSRSVLGLVLRRTMRPVAIGAVLGLAASLATSRILSSLLFGVSPADPVGFGAAVVLVLVIALTVGLVASGRAVRSDPMAILRHE
jgi:putative ABC transport system permease protein